MNKLAILAALAATPALADQPVTINSVAEIGGQPFASDATYAGLGSTGAEVKGTAPGVVLVLLAGAVMSPAQSQ